MDHHFDIDIAKKVGTNCAVILHNISYWVEKNKANKKHFHDGKYWTYNSVAAFSELFPYMSPKVIRSCLDKLKRKGYIMSKNLNKFKYDRTLWYALVPKNSHLPKCINGFAPEGKPIPNKKPQIKKQSNTLSAESVAYINGSLFSSTSIDELGGRVEAVLPRGWQHSWRQTLCGAYGNFKSVELIWERSRDLIYISHSAPPDDPVRLTGANLNFLDLLLREKRDIEEIKERVSAIGWYNYKVERGREVYFNQ